MILLMLLVSIGVKESVRVNTILVIIKIGALLIIIFYGADKVDSGNYEPFFPYGTTGMFKAGAIAFFAYLGVEGIATYVFSSFRLALLGSYHMLFSSIIVLRKRHNHHRR